jgi:hypothetical protein
MKNISYIVGSGPSLLDLSKKNVEFINSSEFILSFNKHIIFYDDIGIVPTHYLLADGHAKAVFTLQEVLRKINDSRLKDIKLFLSKELIISAARVFGKEPLFSALRSRNVTLIRRNDWLKGGAWANKISDPIFHYRGTLSGCINISSMLNPSNRLVLLGVDLHDHTYFFNNHLKRDPKRWAPFLVRQLPETTGNETICEYKGFPGIDHAFPFMLKKVKASGGELLVAGKTSLLYQNGILRSFEIP